jgi:hypothetical protein
VPPFIEVGGGGKKGLGGSAGGLMEARMEGGPWSVIGRRCDRISVAAGADGRRRHRAVGGHLYRGGRQLMCEPYSHSAAWFKLVQTSQIDSKDFKQFQKLFKFHLIQKGFFRAQKI